MSKSIKTPSAFIAGAHQYHAVIIGGGISGLATAFFLSQRASREQVPLKITVLEASDRFGGVLRTLTHEDLHMEAGADAFYAGTKDASDLCRDLGLQDELVEAAPCFRRFFSLKDKKPFPIPGFSESFFSAARFLSDPGLSFSTKCRMLGEPFIPRRKEEGDESLASFIHRRLGQGFYREIAKPLVLSVYMMDPEALSLEALFPRLQQAERTYGSLAASFLRKAIENKVRGRAEFLTLKKGLEGFVRGLVPKLGTCDLRKSVVVKQCRHSAGWELFLEGGEKIRADVLCLAMSSCDAAKLLSGAAPELSGELSEIRYDSIAAVNLIYKSEDVPARDLAPGFLIPREGDPFPFSSLKWLGKTENGKCVLLRAFLSGARMPHAFHESDEMLEKKIRIFLCDFFGVRAEPLLTVTKRYPNALPQYETGHLERVARIEKKVLQYPSLSLAGNGFHGFGITDCIRQAKIAAFGFQFKMNTM